MFLRFFALLAACSMALSVSAQETQAPTPPAAATSLPPVVVETKEAKSKPKASAKKKKSTTSVAVQQPSPAPAAPQPKPTGPGNSSASDKTAYGPVQNYSAKNTATGSKTDTPLNEIPQSVSVVGAEQIRDMGAQTAQEVLRYVPGVVADTYGNDGRTDGGMIRGTEATEYLDGMRRTFGYYVNNYRVDPYFMERLEVLRGPASVLYGQADVGGIVNAVSKRPQTEQGGEITVEYGTFDFKQVKFDMTGPITSDKRWSYRLTGLARDAETQVDYVDDDRLAIAPAITFRPDSNTTITALGHFRQDRAGTISQFLPHVGTIYPNVNGQRISQDRFVGEPGDHYDTDVASGTLLVEHKFSPWLKLNHASRYADVDNDYDAIGSSGYADATEQTIYRYRWVSLANTKTFNQDTNLEAKFSTGDLRHKVLGGVDYTNYDMQLNSGFGSYSNPFNVYHPVYGQPGDLYATSPCGSLDPNDYQVVSSMPLCTHTDQTLQQTGLYVQDQMRLGNWLAVLGARKDWVENTVTGAGTNAISKKDEAISYRAGLMYEFSFGLTPYFSYAESFAAVSDVDRNGNPFDPKQGRTYEVGFKYQPVGANFAINAAIYDMDESNRLVPDPFSIFSQTQIGAVATRGFEFEITGQITKNLKVAGGYAYTDARYDDSMTAVVCADCSDPSNPVYVLVSAAGNQVESIPKHTASLWGVWEFDDPYLKGWSVGAGARYTGTSADVLEQVRVPGVTLFDAMVAYEEEHWRWQISGQNLGDKEVYTTCLQRGDCFIGQARTIITGLTYKY